MNSASPKGSWWDFSTFGKLHLCNESTGAQHFTPAPPLYGTAASLARAQHLAVMCTGLLLKTQSVEEAKSAGAFPLQCLLSIWLGLIKGGNRCCLWQSQIHASTRPVIGQVQRSCSTEIKLKEHQTSFNHIDNINLMPLSPIPLG